MLRRRHSSPVLVGGIAAALALSAAVPTRAQTSAAPNKIEQTNARLLRPVMDGDPNDPPSFSKPLSSNDPKGEQDTKRKNTPATSRFNGLPIFGSPPAAGAGSTGYDSLNRPGSARPSSAATQPGSTSLSSERTRANTDTLGLTTRGLATRRNADDPQSGAQDDSTEAPAQPATTSTAGPAANLPRNAPPAASRTGAYGYALTTATTGSATTTETTGATTTATNRAGKRPTRRPAEDDPFAPVGVRRGGFLLKPSIEFSGGYDNNPARSAGGKGSSFYIVAPEFMAQSLWSRHELTANVKGSYIGYGQTPSLDRPNVEAKVNGRIDVRRDLRIDLEGRGTIATDSPGSPDLPTSVANLPLNFTYGATGGVAKRFNRFELSAKGTFDRAIYGDATLNNGAVDINKDRNYSQYGGALRGSYELTPGVKPFVEIGTDARVHDLAVDRSGFQRDSTGKYAKVGSTFELTRILTGEASVGWLTRNYDDPTLADLSGFTADASLVWLASALTTVTLTAKSSADESTLAGVSGVLTREAAVQVDHAFRRWLIGTAKFGYTRASYDGIVRVDSTYLASLALTYKLSRSLWLNGEVRKDWQHSTEPGSDYQANTVLFGMRWQR